MTMGAFSTIFASRNFSFVNLRISTNLKHYIFGDGIEKREFKNGCERTQVGAETTRSWQADRLKCKKPNTVNNSKTLTSPSPPPSSLHTQTHKHPQKKK